MKAVQFSRFGPPEVLEYVEVDKPTPKKGEVLIKAQSISVNFSDIYMREGGYGKIPLPATPGLEMSGIVESVGEGVTKVSKGESVILLGRKCYAEYALAGEREVTPIPRDIDPDMAAAIPINYLTAYHMIHTVANTQSGQTILAYATAGGVGTAITQLGKLAGIKVIGVTSTDEKAKYAKNQGITHVINFNTEDVVKKVMEITNGKGVDLILDSVAGKTFPTNFDMLAPLGQVILYGQRGGAPPPNTFEKLMSNFTRGVGMRVFSVYSVSARYPELMIQSMTTMIEYLRKKKIHPEIYARIPLREAAKAHKLLESRIVTGKIILKP